MAFAPAAAACIAILFALAGMALVNGRRARFLLPIGGLLLVAVAIFGLIPELVHELGWIRGLLLVAAGFCGIALLERLEERIAHWLVAATALHAFIDGWAMMAVSGRGVLSTAVVTAMMIHKIPEGLALGAILRTTAPRFAVALAFAAELPTILGGFAGGIAVPAAWLNYPLAMAAGAFLFLGIHAQRGVLWPDGEEARGKHIGH
jgi:zinc transporter ZupT